MSPPTAYADSGEVNRYVILGMKSSGAKKNENNAFNLVKESALTLRNPALFQLLLNLKASHN